MARRSTPWVAAALAVALLCSAQLPLQAAPIPSRADDGRATGPSGDAATVRDFLAREDVGRALASLGLSADEVRHRVDRLSDEDLRQLASNLDQVRAAGEQVPEYIWWLLGGLLGVLILSAIF